MIEGLIKKQIRQWWLTHGTRDPRTQETPDKIIEEANKEFPDPDDYEEHYENQMWDADDILKDKNYFEEMRFSETLYIEAVKKWRKKWLGDNK